MHPFRANLIPPAPIALALLFAATSAISGVPRAALAVDPTPSSIAGLCYSVQYVPYLEQMHLSQGIEAELRRGDDFNLMQGFATPWLYSLVPTPEVRRFGLEEGLHYFGTKYGFHCTKRSECLRAADARLKVPAKSSATAPLVSLLTGSLDQADAIEQSLLSKVAICAQYTPLHTGACTRALDHILAVMHPVADINLVPVIRKVFEDPTYVRGAVIAARRVLAYFSSPTNSGAPLTIGLPGSAGNLYSELIQAYGEAGLSATSAEDHAWDLLGVLSTNGADTSLYVSRAFRNPNPQLLLAIQVLSAGPVAIDALRIPAHLAPYSYPAGLRTTCNYSKPYHFWMAAYLARLEARTQRDATAGLYASWIVELGYQMRSETFGRKPARPFTVDSRDDGNDRIRLDLAFAAAGAVYGKRNATLSKETTLDVDRALTKLIDGAGPSAYMNPLEAESLWSGTGADGYFEWRKLFAPDAALNSLLSP